MMLWWMWASVLAINVAFEIRKWHVEDSSFERAILSVLSVLAIVMAFGMHGIRDAIRERGSR